MKYIKSYLFLVLTAALALTGCKQDDLQDDVDALANRVAILEEQVKLLNENLETISFVLNSENKTIQSVTQSGNAYTLTLSNGETLTLNIGVQGSIDVPEIPEDAEYNSLISISEDGYWVIRGEKTGHKAVGQPGANGSGYPEFRVNDGKWQVRFLSDDGEVTDWKDVEGTANTSIGEIGDQLIAGVDTSDPTRLTITYYTNYSEGTTEEVSLPIVPGLICQIVTNELLDGEGYLQMEAGTIQTLSVKISGGTPQLTYPSGWRATIEDPESDGMYELTIYSPAEDAATASAQSRVSANNTEDVTVRVQSGMYWAVDKVKVRTPKVYNNDYDRYADGQTITIGGIEINEATYGAATNITASQSISAGGVYFITGAASRADDGEIVLSISSDEVIENLIIIASDEVDASLQMSKSIKISKTLVAQNMDIKPTANIWPFTISGTDVNVVFNKCLIEGLYVTKGLLQPETAGTSSVGNMEMSDTDVKITYQNEDANGRLYLINTLPCDKLTLTNNIIYSVPDETHDDYLKNLKIFNCNGDNPQCPIGELVFNNNTIVNAKSDNTALVYAYSIGKVAVNGNLYWVTNPDKGTFMIRTRTLDHENTAEQDAQGGENFGYINNTDADHTQTQIKVYYTSGTAQIRPSTIPELTSTVEFFDIDNSGVFDYDTGTFIPQGEAAGYGAQR